jgi:hypothetical protein
VKLPSHAQSFLEQLGAALPPGYEVRLDTDWLQMTGPPVGVGVPAAWLLDTALFEEDATSGATAILDQVQTAIAEETTEPWPAKWQRGYRGGLPRAEAEVVGDRLYAWFGRTNSPMFELGPVDLAAVILRDELG